MAYQNLLRVREELRQMIRTTHKEIKETFLKTQKDVKDQLEKITQEIEVEDESKLSKIKEEVEVIKANVESTLKPLQRVDPKAGETKEKKGKKTDDSDSEWPMFDCKLECILENAAQSYKLSEFDKLDPKLKICLLCFAIFPQDAKIKKRTMIYWWIGESIVKASDDETAEEIGKKCFQDLIEGSWIDPVNDKSRKIVHECTLDPWVRWLMIFKARELDFFDLDETGMPYPYSPSSLSRSKSPRACLVLTKKTQLDHQNNREGLVPLWTVFNVNTKRLNFQTLLKKQDSIRNLRVLQLGRWQSSATHHIELDNKDFESSKQFGQLETLRYLSLSGIFRIRKLPTWIRKLRNLQILDLRDCQNLEQLGEDVRYLQNLTHLDVSECYLLDHMPKGLGSLLQLEVLKGFVFGSLRSSDPCRLRELTKLNHLKKLSINLGIGEQIQQDDMNLLKGIQNLRSLAITWGVLSETSSAEGKEKVTEKSTRKYMCFPPNLEKLDLRCFPEEGPPEWLEPSGLGNLKKLYIRGGKLQTFVNRQETEETTWKVDMLRLKYLPHLDEEWPKVEEIFPDLTYLEICECPKLKQPPPVDKERVWLKEGKPDTNAGDTNESAMPPSTSPTTTPSVDSTQAAVTPVVDTNVGNTVDAATVAPTSTTTPSVDSTQAAVTPLVDTNVGDTDAAATAAPTSTPATTSTSVGSIPPTDAPANLSSSANNEEETPSHTTITTDVAPQVTPNLTSPLEDDVSVADSSNQDHRNTPSPPPPDLASPRDDASVADSSNQDHGNAPPPPPPPTTTNETLTSAPPSTPVNATVVPSSTTSNQEQNPSPTTTTDIPTVTPPTPDSTFDSSPPKSSPTTTTPTS